ncbi:MAG: metallophosphoesterase [Thermoplasmata archaeon]
MSGPGIPAGPARLRSPEEILEMEPEEADELLDRLEAQVPMAPSRLVDFPVAPVEEAIVFGDTHGDWRSTVAAVELFGRDPNRRALVGLGDYLDRAPDDCAEGSVANALYLLQWVAEYPDRVVLIQGNHETTRRLPVLPMDTPEEVDALWGPEVDRYARLMGLLERGPLAAVSPSGAYLAHGGFPRAPTGVVAREAFRSPSDDTILDVVWGDCGASRSHRGVSVPFTEPELLAFLHHLGARIFLRGHDPDLVGRPVFHDRCLTLHTTRVYERFGGVIVGRLPIGRRVETVRDVAIEHLPTEGRAFVPPH